MNLNLKRMNFGENLCHIAYVEWFISEVLLGNIKAQGFMESYSGGKRYDIYGAWTGSDWTGAIKPNTDLLKQAKGYQVLVNEGWITNERSARELTGTKFRKNMKRIIRENQLKLEAANVFVEIEEKVGPERARALLHGDLLELTEDDFLTKEEPS